MEEMILKNILKILKTKIKSKSKVFVIGFNKTGTTTLKSVLWELGYSVGSQREGELLLGDWQRDSFKKIFALCETAECFQDIPFSLPRTYMHLYEKYKDAKFILSVRDSSNQWYNSLCNFHSKMWNNGRGVPNAEIMKQVQYVKEGYAYESFKLIFETNDDDLYNKDRLIQTYEEHNEEVRAFFEDKKNSLIELNVSKESDYKKLCEFLNKEPKRGGFLWENKTTKL